MVKKTEIAELYLDICGIRIDVSLPEGDLYQEAKGKYQGFIAGKEARGERQYEMILEERVLPWEDREICLGKNGEFIRIKGETFDGSMDLAAGRGQLILKPEVSALDMALRVLFSSILLRHDGILLHSAGLARGGKGYAFFGPSTSGKTTITRASSGMEILNDELIGIRRMSSGFSIFPTPFHGEMKTGSRNGIFDLAAMFLLDRKAGKYPEEIKGTEMLTEIMGNIFVFEQDRKAGEILLNICVGLCREVGGFRINVTETKTPEGVIDEVSGIFDQTGPSSGLAGSG